MNEARQNGSKAAHKRVSIGAIFASLTTALVFGLWRIAATFDSATGTEGWLWLLFQSAILLWTFPIFCLLMCGAGAWLVFKGSGSRGQSICVAALTTLVYGLGLTAVGLFGVEEAGVLSSTPVSLAALMAAGAAGGYVGHNGWTASQAELDRLDPDSGEGDATRSRP